MPFHALQISSEQFHYASAKKLAELFGQALKNDLNGGIKKTGELGV